MSGVAFLDTEAVTLAAGPDVLWEIGAITRDDGRPDQEWRFQLRPNMGRADPRSLEISRYYQRYQVPRRVQALAWSPFNGSEPARLTYSALAFTLDAVLHGRHVFGLCPSFDTVRLGLFLRKQIRSADYQDPWHYQPHDVEDMVVGYLHGRRSMGKPVDVPVLPYDTNALSRAVGVEPPSDEDRHTALGDARHVRDLYDAVTGGSA